MSSTPLHRFPQSMWASAQDLARHVRLGLVNLAMKILPVVNRWRAIAVRAKSPRCTRSGALVRTPRRALATLAPGRARCCTRPRPLSSQVKRAIFGRELGRVSGNQPRAGFGNLKFLFLFLGYFKSIQTSKIHNRFNIHPKFMKSVSIFFLIQDLLKKNIKLNIRP
jgi:hypothetical protein